MCFYFLRKSTNIEPITENTIIELYSFAKIHTSYIELQQIDSLEHRNIIWQHNTIQTRGIKNFWTHLFLTA